MAISIAWGTKIIYVPKADLDLIQPSPEVRELDLDWFRLQLKALEDDPEGMPFPDTHRHNTEVELAGLTYARIIEIINGYTVEFEDGYYTVNCVGANHNLSDVKVANSVSLIVNNAAGLITNAAIEYSSYNGGVTVDVLSSYDGTLFPVGTPQRPVNNMDDALVIAQYRGFTTFYIIGDVDIDDSNDYGGFIFIGESQTKTEINISSSAQVDGCEFYDATVVGTLDGDTKLKNCAIGTLNYINGVIEQCLLEEGVITLGGGAEAYFLDCWSGPAASNTPTIDLGGSGQELSIRNYNGEIKLRNKTGSDPVSLDINSGHVILESTITNGTIVVRGIGKLTDNSTGSAVVEDDDYLNPTAISTAILDAGLSKVLGLVQENYFLDQTVYDAVGNLTSARLRTYTDSGSVGTDSNVLATYTITSVWDGTELQTYKVELQ